MNLVPHLENAAAGGSVDGLSAAKALRACGWLAKNDLSDPRLKVETLSRSHVVTRVTAPDGRTAVVKYPTKAALDAGRDLARELCVYRLAGWRPAIASVLPRPILLDEERQVLAVEYAGLAGTEWPMQFAPFPITIPAVAAGLGMAMASWHEDSTGISLLPSLAEGVLHLGDEIDAAIAGRSPAVRRFMRFVAEDIAFSGILGEAKSSYRRDCLIHGDIRGDNWVLQDDTLKVIDWEMSGAGDPAWDVASAIAEMVLQAVRDDIGGEPGPRGWPHVVEDLAPIFLDAYRSVRGQTNMREQLVPFTVARLLHVASEWVDAAGEVASEDDDFAATGITPILATVRGLVHKRNDATNWLAS